MAKFFGVVGYAGGTVEDPPESGVWKEQIVERQYYGDIVRNTRQLQEGEKVNSDLSVSNSISIVADAYAMEHFHAIRYVLWSGATWVVRDIDASSRPRLLLRLGGVYNGAKGTAASDT